MSTFDSTKIPLREVIDDIKKGNFQLPDFQRGWVWDDEHVRSLLVSIARSFPVGAIMTLATGGDIRFQVRPVENVKIDSEKEPDTLILDGQQRLTSLTQVLGLEGPVNTFDNKKSKIERYYYVDIKKILEGADYDEAFYSVGKEKKVTSNFGRNVELDISTIDKEVSELQFPCNQILDYDDWQDRCYELGKFKEFKAFKKAVLEPFRDYQIPVIALNKTTTKEAVCLVFEKVNTGGVSLTAFELITASFAADGYNLREDWYGNGDSSIGRLARLKEEKILGGVQTTDFLQAVTLLHTYDLNQKARELGKADNQLPGISCKRKAMLNLQLADYQKWAEKLESGFKLVAKFLQKECFFSSKDIPYRTQLVPLAAIMTHLGERWLQPKVYDRLSQWFWCGVMGELYGSAVENRFANDIEDFLIWVNDETKAPRTVFDASFHPSRLETLRTRNSAAYKGLNILTLRNGAKDFYWKAGVQELDLMEARLEIHHLFPKKWCAAKGVSKKITDSVINKTPISFKANRKIGGDAPSGYLQKIQKDEQVGLTDIEMDQILDSHLIDPGAFRTNNFTQFLNLRSIELVNLIYRAMGKEEKTPTDFALFGYDSKEQSQKSVLDKLASEESEVLEFKSTLRWDVKQDVKNTKLEDIIIKTIAAFNNRYGGTLMIGVDDDKNVLGLDLDYQTFKEADRNTDHYEIHIRNLVNDRFGTDFATSQMTISFPNIEGVEFCQIDVKRGKVPKYLEVANKHGVKSSTFYVRSGNSSQALSVEEVANYVKERFPNL
ncbi:GmrSD restriction endonuclease domain-containing protein [Leucothrix pacifica]|uniref:DUF262 domain-containing protein n=1 Tax=Leucothrix pacifica TaxID=1247513 RepID=A0A317CKB1_9GAMM|nr:DUF262 domain-containing protein [Leucothrix pacifica]PWQ99035.1 hypothetical protein DKW60_06200 [Leucothrix pacifica]